ncbi:MAG TPA: hypothetical protein VN026_07665 [Bacteroidia bacterium]|jgi:hypothetical protein|nr:hypothetical protein [Bacteroidia bacterium]
MKYTLKIIFLVFFINNLCAQQHELGIGINGYKGFKDNGSNIDTSGYSHTKSIVTFNPILTYNFINKKHTEFIFHIGYFYEPSTTNQKSTVSSPSYVSTSFDRGNRLSKSWFFKLGIGKRYNFENFIFISAINIPMEFNYYYSYDYYTYYYGNGTLTSFSETHDKLAPTLNTGINLQQSFYYKLCNKFLIGFDLNVGYNIGIINGTRNYSSNNTNYNPYSTSPTSQTIKYKYQMSSQISFVPVINVRYILPIKKEEKPKQ